MKQKKNSTQHIPQHRNIPVVNADFREGLTPEEIRLRQQNGLRNITPASNTKTERQIVKEKVFTFFNLIFIVLAAALLLVGSFKNLAFLLDKAESA